MATDLSLAERAAALPPPARRDAARPRKRVIALALCVAALTLAVQAGWIHAKAGLAQWLLHDAWTHTLATGKPHAPWPWADTAPVARLRAPGQGVDQIVLAGDSGRTLAFGPGWAESSAAPGTHGTVVVSGHRDTHFAFLRDLAVGDEVLLQGPAGETRYRVADTRIADARSERLALDADTDTLWLVTCWPFDALTAGGPMRFAVRAVRTDAVASVP
ncbi:class GN sortase [Chiayiivirga flava]|uniref:Sortase A n=1 Tax=Chiayiivirga flava TaxID=659595 RepID=A0A7W8D5U5_9GAMM|nr:class GN sortase [Chiayiivirga flava]MBB5208092.1 sortase A [Chiayiivirga flava]